MLHPVRVVPGGLGNQTRYEVLLPGGLTQVYDTKRQLVAALTGHPTGRNWTFDRYFRLGKYAPKTGLADGDLGAVLGWTWETRIITSPDSLTITPEVRVLDLREDRKLTVAPSSSPASSSRRRRGAVPESMLPSAETVAKRVAAQGGVLGIDLVGRADEVANLLFSGFGSWIYSSGYDPEDVLQQVYLGLVTRNAGRCPWDASKSSFGHYVHMVCQGVVSNYHRKQKRTKEMEQTGIKTYSKADGFVLTDVAAADIPSLPMSIQEERDLVEATVSLSGHIETIGGPDAVLGKKVLPLLRDGYTKAEIASKLGESRATIARVIEFVQSAAREWYVTT